MLNAVNLNITGMSCVNCSNSIESYLSSTNGVTEVSVNFSTGTGRVSYDGEKIKLEEIISLIEELGFKARAAEDAGGAAKRGSGPAKFTPGPELIVAVAFAVPVFILNMFYCHISWAPKVMALLSLPVLLYSGMGFHKKTVSYLFKRLPLTMDALVSASSFSSFLLSFFLYFVKGSNELYFDSSTSIIAIILVGKTIEERIRTSARSSLTEIIESMPSVCTIREGESEREAAVRDVRAGELVVVKPNGKVPVDGVVSSGEGFVESSAITGESVPVYARSGDTLYAGSQNLDSIFEIRAVTPGSHSYINGIEEMLRAALSKKAEIQRTADIISSYFVPAVFGLSVITFLGQRFVFAGGLESSLISAISVIAIACPCALGLALPVAFLFGTNLGAGRGILFTDPDSLGKLKNVNSIVFDKTGTLTKNRLKVEKYELAGNAGIDENTFLQITGSVQRYSDHPIARAFIEFLKGRGINSGLEVSGYKTHGGKGVSATCHGHKVVIGNAELVCAGNEHDSRPEAFEGKPSFYAAIDQMPAAYFELSEELSEGAAETVSELAALGVKVYLLTGDREGAAFEIAGRVGIARESVMASVKPHEKAEFIDRLKAGDTAANVLMIGDGINDSLAMARADIAIAMADATTIAKTAATIIMTRHGLKNVVTALELGKKMHRIIIQNFFWAFFYNIILIPSAMAGKLNPMQAAFAMILSSLFVVLNSTRLRKL